MRTTSVVLPHILITPFSSFPLLFRASASGSRLCHGAWRASTASEAEEGQGEKRTHQVGSGPFSLVARWFSWRVLETLVWLRRGPLRCCTWIVGAVQWGPLVFDSLGTDWAFRSNRHPSKWIERLLRGQRQALGSAAQQTKSPSLATGEALMVCDVSGVDPLRSPLHVRLSVMVDQEYHFI